MYESDLLSLQNREVLWHHVSKHAAGIVGGMQTTALGDYIFSN